MAHLVTNLLNEKGDLVLNGSSAWHGLGTVITENLSLSDALKYSGLDFQVAKKELTYNIEGCSPIQFDDAFFTYRTDLNIILGKHVGKTYEPMQNIEALNVVEEFLEKGYSIESAGALDNGRLTFVTMRLNSFDVTANDSINQYIVISNSHDGSSAIKAYLTNVRVVCANTLNFSLKDASNIISIRHTSTSVQRLQEATKILVEANKLVESSAVEYRSMAKNAISKKDLVNYVSNLFLDEKDLKRANSKDDKISTRKVNIIDSVLSYALDGIGQKDIYGSAWGAYNAVTGYFSNVKTYSNDNTKFREHLGGQDTKLMNRALELAMDFDKVKTIDIELSYSAN